MNKNRIKKFYTTGDVARYCEVDVNTVKRWIRQGSLKAFSTPSGHYRITRDRFISFTKEQGFTFDAQYFGEGQNKTDILIIEDDFKQLDLFIDLFDHEYRNLKIETATNGFDGYVKVHNSKPKLVILDLSIPEDTGLEFLRAIRARDDLRDLGIVVISNDIDGPTQMELEMLKVNGVLHKPINEERFMEECSSFFQTDNLQRAAYGKC